MSLLKNKFDEVVLATGIKPRQIPLSGIDSEKVLSYLDVLKDHKPVGQRVAIIGAGGIGFDVASYLTEHENLVEDVDKWLQEWGVDKDYQHAGALAEKTAVKPSQDVNDENREIYLLQRKTSKVGKGLGKTTGWIHRATLAKKGVKMIAGVDYKEVNDKGLLINIDGKEKQLDVDHIIICAGQESDRSLYQSLLDAGQNTHLIGGASVAAELDAKRAIRQAAELAATI